MNVCVYVCVCMYVCVCVCVYVCMYVACMYVCMYVMYHSLGYRVKQKLETTKAPKRTGRTKFSYSGIKQRVVSQSFKIFITRP